MRRSGAARVAAAAAVSSVCSWLACGIDGAPEWRRCLGRLVRGRGLGYPTPEGPDPAFALYAFGEQPPVVAWESVWVPWPDFALPADEPQAADAARQAWRRAAAERVEVACWGGRGRTGTVLACLAVLDGCSAEQAVAHVRAEYNPGAVETAEQEAYVARFAASES